MMYDKCAHSSVSTFGRIRKEGGYRVAAAKGEARFEAACTSVYRRRAHDDWSVVQHAQIPLELQQETPDGR